MQKRRIAFVFINMPYGQFSVNEGFDFLLSACVLFDQIGVFFISDGVFSLLSDQNPNKKFNKNFTSLLEILSLCGVSSVCLCADSAFERGLTKTMRWISKVEVIWLSLDDWRHQLLSYDIVLRF